MVIQSTRDSKDKMQRIWAQRRYIFIFQDFAYGWYFLMYLKKNCILNSTLPLSSKFFSGKRSKDYLISGILLDGMIMEIKLT